MAIDGEGFLDLSEMNPSDIISKLKHIEASAESIWNAIEEHFGPGFFNIVIEKQFGIVPGASDALKSAFEKKILEIMRGSNDRIEDLRNTLTTELVDLRVELQAKDSEVVKIRK